jgi:pyrroline-5-carboxylate reductase
MTLGFIGTGTMAAAMVEGLGGTDILVSPRGAELAAGLVRRFPGVRVAADNQAVIDGCDMVVLSVRPQVAEAVIRPLRFRAGQTVVSLIAATQIACLRDWIGFDLPIIRAIPLPFVADRASVTPVFPPDAEVVALFDRLGTALPCRDIAEFDLLAVGSALMGSYFGLLETAQGWLQAQGLEDSAARTYLAGLFANLGKVAVDSPADFATLRAGHSTPGGLNEQIFRDFAAGGGTAALIAALDRVLARVRGQTG